jgi:GTP-binding protein
MARNQSFSLLLLQTTALRQAKPSEQLPVNSPVAHSIQRRFSRKTSTQISMTSQLRHQNEITSEDIDSLRPRRFTDVMRIEVEGGKGGPGCYSFIRTRSITSGHADGGNGGVGGDVYLQAQAVKPCDLSYFKKLNFIGNEGRSGKRAKKNGDPGNPIIVAVPVGTKVYKVVDIKVDGIPKEKLELLTKKPLKDQEKVLVARGGKPGLGSCDKDYMSERQAGLSGQKVKLELLLSIPNDVALVGFSGTGKTSFLGTVTRTLGQIGGEGPATIHPSIGDIKFIDGKKVHVLDLPPIKFENILHPITSEAEEGLNRPSFYDYKYIHHLQSSKLIVFVMDASSVNLNDDVINLLKFVKQYDLAEKKIFFALNKRDLLVDGQEDKIKAYFIKLKAPFAFMSASNGEDTTQVVAYLRKMLLEK